jgi:hypothetical protein
VTVVTVVARPFSPSCPVAPKKLEKSGLKFGEEQDAEQIQGQSLSEMRSVEYSNR